MRLKLDTKELTIFTSSKPEISPVFGFEDGKRLTDQARDKETNLPLWSVIVELVQGENSEQGKKIKVASADAPTLNPRTEYKVSGSLFATPYVPNGGRNAEISYLMVGAFTSTSGAAPALKQN